MRYTAVVPIVEGHGEVRALPALISLPRECIEKEMAKEPWGTHLRPSQGEG